MTTSKAQTQNLKMLMSIVAVLAIAGVFVFMLSLKNRTDQSQKPNDQDDTSEIEEINGNKIVIQNETSYSAEGSNLPGDIQWGSILPGILSSDRLVGVVDNGQLDSRNVTLKYKLDGGISETESVLMNQFGDLGWAMEKGVDSSYRANQADKHLYMDLEEVDPTTTYATLLFNLPKGI